VDAIDKDGDPVIVHACHSITPDDLQETLSCPVGQAGDKLTVAILVCIYISTYLYIYIYMIHIYLCTLPCPVGLAGDKHTVSILV
jgi:hypothetical protein